ncbi:MAG: helix-turn-helix transcriptional regulator [Clostridiales bacterium]|jgi:transcriptional regulator with XRE-family HTH domain|nr:helix-turn-helix transcriptional regulator [Clostridiales bacterium]
MENLQTRITNNLKREIETCGKSKSQIATELGISKPTLSQYLSGRIMPSLPTFAKLCEVIDCSADDILFME